MSFFMGIFEKKLEDNKKEEDMAFTNHGLGAAMAGSTWNTGTAQQMAGQQMSGQQMAGTGYIQGSLTGHTGYQQGWVPPTQPIVPSTEFVVDMVFAAVEANLRKIIREELEKALNKPDER
jgi:hypothetical protein